MGEMLSCVPFRQISLSFRAINSIRRSSLVPVRCLRYHSEAQWISDGFIQDGNTP